MVNPSKQKGTAAETALVDWFRSHGHTGAHRNPPAGTNDVGDIGGVTTWCDIYGEAAYVVIEVKNRRDLATSIRDGLNELEAEKITAGTRHGVLVTKSRGVGLGRAGEWYAIRRVADDPQIGDKT